MVAESLLAFALCVVAAPPEDSGPATVTLEELNAFVDAGNYHRIRVEKLGHRFRASGTVEMLAAHDGLPIVALPGHLRAGLQGIPEGHGLAVGDRVRFDGLIVDEGYACLQVWTYDFEKLSKEEPAAEPAPSEGTPTIRFCGSPPASPPSQPEPVQRNASNAKTSEELLPKVTPADLDAAMGHGDYLRVRNEYVGLRLDAEAVVEKVGAWALVRLSENWQAHLHSHSDDFGLKEGDRIRVVGLICDEAYSAVTVWVERVEKLPAK